MGSGLPGRIALVRRAYTPYGGAERFLDQVARRLAERGEEVHLVCESWRGEGRPGLERGRRKGYDDCRLNMIAERR